MKKLIIGFGLFLCACHTTTPDLSKVDTANLDALQSLATTTVNTHVDVARMREEALQETAQSLGARGALAYRGQQINTVLTTEQKMLDRIYQFDAMVLPDNVLPPVLTEARNTLNLADDLSLRLADRTYLIKKQAKFVTRPPNWRDYIEMNYSKPDAPDKSLLPRNKAEEKIWRKYIRVGWQQGIQQANEIFNNRLAELNMDYTGMALYRKLLAQGMVSAPFVAKTDMGVTGGGDDMRVNDQVLRITALPSLNAGAKQWQPAVSDGQ